MDKLELKIPPPVIALAVGAAMWLLARLAPALMINVSPRLASALALILALCGAAVALAGIVAFRMARTTIHPHQPEKTSSIVSSGVYRLTRNPMYLGLLLVLAGWAVHLANLLAWVLLPLFVWLIQRLQIRPEERILSARFGAAYDEYRRSVRRWI